MSGPPISIRPMLATLVGEPFHREGWVYEEKYDGFRIVAYKDGRRVTLMTRNLKDRTGDFPDLAAAVAKLAAPTLVLDGEVVIFDPEGISRFQLMQRRAEGAAVYVVFDCLFARGRDLRARPLRERRQALEAEVRESETLRLARRLSDDGLAAFREAKKRGLEGLIAKDGASHYEDGARSMAWRKVKVRNEEEFVIGGFTRPEGSRSHFGAILVGAWQRGTLRYAGKVGTGYTAKMLADLMARFHPLVRPTSPFADAPRERRVTWLEPSLIAQVGFTELTDDGRLRHPTFLGLRDDKAASEVRWPRRG
ncbi:MAG: ATP-dependent DNA ligase [Candidatus Rokubacteria bacterium]|nr:ATP-dependent DNA ligase [Candidatus Rokubacteria bacterium]